MMSKFYVSTKKVTSITDKIVGTRRWIENKEESRINVFPVSDCLLVLKNCVTLKAAEEKFSKLDGDIDDSEHICADGKIDSDDESEIIVGTSVLTIDGTDDGIIVGCVAGSISVSLSSSTRKGITNSLAGHVAPPTWYVDV